MNPNPTTTIYLVVLILTGLFTIIGYLFKRDQTNQDSATKALQILNLDLNKEIKSLENQYIMLNAKLWSEEKLSKTITDAVKLAFSEWQLRMIKEGWFYPPNSKK